MDKPEEKINGRMTGALTIYSATFMRYAWSTSQRNIILTDSGYSKKLSSFCVPCYQWNGTIRSTVPIHELLAVCPFL